MCADLPGVRSTSKANPAPLPCPDQRVRRRFPQQPGLPWKRMGVAFRVPYSRESSPPQADRELPARAAPRMPGASWSDPGTHLGRVLGASHRVEQVLPICQLSGCRALAPANRPRSRMP